ncbi:MAG: iron ABC transporter permease [Hadesarchaea archaeon]|nr:MAG: iron ABC transporter permease [Hadesarchaea archaeon]
MAFPSLAGKRVLKGSALFFLLLSPFLLAFLSVGIGYLRISPGEIFSVFLAKLTGQPTDRSLEAVIFQIRMPRIVLAGMVGAALATAGAVLQAMFRNPLVEPYLLGISSAAAFGASLALAFAGGFLLQPLAFLFGLLSVYLAYTLARVRGEVPIINLVLAGVILSALFMALTSLVKYLVDPHVLAGIVYWMMGSFSGASWKGIGQVAPPLIFCLALLFLMSWRLNVLSLSEEEARALGVKVARERLLFLTLATLLTSLSVSLCGIIGWVGLLVPHLVRLAFSSNTRVLVPLSASLGASFMIAADDIARSILSFELPISVITTVMGAPLFIALMRRGASRVWR